MGKVRELVIRLNGSVLETVTVPPNTQEAELRAAVLNRPLVREGLRGRFPSRVAFSADGTAVDVIDI